MGKAFALYDPFDDDVFDDSYDDNDEPPHCTCRSCTRTGALRNPSHVFEDEYNDDMERGMQLIEELLDRQLRELLDLEAREDELREYDPLPACDCGNCKHNSGPCLMGWSSDDAGIEPKHGSMSACRDGGILRQLRRREHGRRRSICARGIHDRSNRQRPAEPVRPRLQRRPADLPGAGAVPVEVHERGWQWLPIDKKTAFVPPFGTIRQCRVCGCLVAGGPTACARCAKAGV